MKDDSVSRKAAIDVLNSLKKWSLMDRNEYLHGVGVRLKSAVQKLEQLPSAQTERPTAKWIEESDGWDGFFWTCSACGDSMEFTDGGPEENGFEYCPYCGAKMEGVLDD